MSYLLEINLAAIQAKAVDLQAENDLFTSFIQKHDSEQIDAIVFDLQAKISAQINCTQCGNCCKSLMIVVEDEEVSVLANYLHMPRNQFEETYLEKGTQGMMLMNTIPCHFLSNHQCTVYPTRPAGCREFPAMHLPHFTRRLFTTFMHYARCPIIFNVVESLKKELRFN
jgi:uncharacterized protein